MSVLEFYLDALNPRYPDFQLPIIVGDIVGLIIVDYIISSVFIGSFLLPDPFDGIFSILGYGALDSILCDQWIGALLVV